MSLDPSRPETPASLRAKAAESLVDRLASGLPVQEAYALLSRDLAAFAGKHVGRSVLSHMLTEDARSAVEASSLDLSEPPTIAVVVEGGSVSGIPKASCMARMLGHISHPSREEVRAAIQACSAAEERG